MKSLIQVIAFVWLILGANTLRGEVIALWDFNSQSDDRDASTGTLQPAVGTGSAISLGSVEIAFGTVAGGTTSDVSTTDNSQARLNKFASRGFNNKGNGLQLRAGTVGFESIRFYWDHYNSGTASRYWRVQYTVDGGTWIDHTVFTNSTPSTWLRANSVSFQEISGANDNPNFGVRLVSEFESTATGEGLNEYRAVNATGNYSTAGTLWLDMVRIEGYRLIPNNEPPTISKLPNVIIEQNNPTGPIAFTVSDLETPSDQLELSIDFSDPGQIQSFEFAGTGATRTLQIIPVKEAYGNITVAVTVTDSGGAKRESSFILAIVRGNTPPKIARQEDLRIIRKTQPPPLTIKVSDAESPADELTLSVRSSNPFLLPNSNLFLTRGSGERILTIQPATSEVGSATLTLSLSDGVAETETSFKIEVLPEFSISSWNFNSLVPDDDPASGTLDPVEGSGSARAVGDTSSSFGTVGLGRTSDPAQVDNSMWRLGHFPSQGQGNKTAGVEFYASTVGYSNICLTWDQYNSATASRYWRIQYTTDGTLWNDYRVFTNFTAGAWTKYNGVSFHSLPEVNQNPRFGVRIVSEFAGTVVESTSQEYEAIGSDSSYGASGTLWIDSVRIAGDVAPLENAPPLISQVPDQHLPRFQDLEVEVEFSDDHTPYDQLLVSASAEQPELLSQIEIRREASGRAVLFLRPAEAGESVITLRVTDSEGLTSEAEFKLTVSAPNNAPTISEISSQCAAVNQTVGPLLFTIADSDQDVSELALAVASSNPDLVAPEHIQVTSTGPEHFITVYPEPYQTGESVITVTVSDGELTASASFTVQFVSVGMSVIAQSGSLQLMWPVEADRFTLEASSDLVNWIPIGLAVTRNEEVIRAEVPNAAERQFFRLVK